MKTLRPICVRGFGLLVLLGAAMGRAQSVLPSTSSAAAPPAGTGAPAGKTAGKSLLQTAQGANLPLFKRGPVSLRPHLLYRVLYADGLLNPQQTEDDSSVIYTASPGLLVEIGDSWTLDYTYTRSEYSSQFFRDTDDHSVSVATAYRGDRWAFTGAESYGKSTPTLVETGGTQTPQESLLTDLNLVLHLGQRTELTTSGTISNRQVNREVTDPQWTNVDWTSWVISEMLQYELGPHISIGTGVEAGYDSIKPGADMSHFQPTGRILWTPTDKIFVSVQAGIEQRQFEGGRDGKIENPVYRGRLQYAPLATTKFSASASRAFSASYFANWATRSTGWSTGLEQRLLKRLYLNIDYSEAETRYIPTTLAASLSRTDQVRTVAGRLSTAFLGTGSLSLIYQNGQNDSSERGFSFTSHQYGAEIAYRF